MISNNKHIKGKRNRSQSIIEKQKKKMTEELPTERTQHISETNKAEF